MLERLVSVLERELFNHARDAVGHGELQAGNEEAYKLWLQIAREEGRGGLRTHLDGVLARDGGSGRPAAK